MMDDEQTADFEAYAYDNGNKGDGKGIYIAYSNLENEAEAAGYTLETDENGETVLTFYAKDGVISYMPHSPDFPQDVALQLPGLPESGFGEMLPSSSSQKRVWLQHAATTCVLFATGCGSLLWLP